MNNDQSHPSLINRLLSSTYDFDSQDERRRARLFSILSIILIPLSLINCFFLIFLAPNILPSGLLFTLILVGVYFISRTKWWSIGALVSIGAFITWPVSLMFLVEDQQPLALIWLIPALILASLLFNFKQTLLINAIAILAAAASLVGHHNMLEEGIPRILATIVIIGALLPIGTKIRDDDELIIASQNKKLSTINQELEARVLARTAQLKEAKEVAEKANAVKTAFLAIMSHELRTPLNAIIGYSDLIAEYVDEDDYSKQDIIDDVGLIGNSGTHLLLLINQVLDYATLESGEPDLSIVDISSADIIQNTLSIIKPLAGKEKLELILENRLEQPLIIQTDFKRTCQILINLLDNAVKYTFEGSVTLEVDEVDFQGSPHISFGVRDSGIGIPQDALNQIFDSFTQVKNDYSRKYDGAGLGLAISKEYCQMLGGHILVESQEGIGSCFTLLLPLVKA